jgi:hypothetical protein
MARELLVFANKNFKISIPDEAKVTFGPWSPGTGEGKYQMSDKALNGTLRVYETAKTGASILAVFSGVTGFRDTGLEYAEEVAREEGAVIWKSDQDGYRREEKVSQKRTWVVPEITAEGSEDDEEADS